MYNLNLKTRDLSLKRKQMLDAGMIPAVVYGGNIETEPVMVRANELKKAFKTPGEVYTITTKNGEAMVKLEEVQRSPVSNEIIHVSLKHLEKGKKDEIEIPINLKGDPPGVKKGGVLVVLKDEVLLSGKPKSLPTEVMADISHLEIGDKITAGDLNTPKGVAMEENPEDVIAICNPPIKDTVRVEEEEVIEESGFRLTAD